MWIIYAYKEMDEGEFDDGDNYAFGPYSDEDNAREDEASLLDGPYEWQTMVLEVRTLPVNA
jgi:hypothetical protein